MLFEEVTASTWSRSISPAQGHGEPVRRQSGGLRHPLRRPRCARGRDLRPASPHPRRSRGRLQKNGLLPISQQSLFVLASLSYHDYEGVALNEAEKPRLVADLGKNTFLILPNHGLLTVGRSIADAFLAMYTLESTCRSRSRPRPVGAR